MQKRKWGEHWPRIGSELISPVLKKYHFKQIAVDEVDGFIRWERPDVTELISYEITVNPNTSSTPKHIAFSGLFFVNCNAAGQLQVDAGIADLGFASVLLSVPLAWMVRHAQINEERYVWDISYDEPEKSINQFDREFALSFPNLAEMLSKEDDVAAFLLNLEKFSGDLKGGPPFRPAEMLKTSALCFVHGEVDKAHLLLDKYAEMNYANLRSNYVGSNGGESLRLALCQSDNIVTKMRARYAAFHTK
jgi:hypothetical protein